MNPTHFSVLREPLYVGDYVSWGVSSKYYSGARIGQIKALKPKGKLTCQMLTEGSPSVEASRTVKCSPPDPANFIGLIAKHVHVPTLNNRWGYDVVDEAQVYDIEPDLGVVVKLPDGSIARINNKLLSLRFED